MQGELMVRVSARASLFIITIALACGRTTAPLCDICTTGAVVYGSIRSPAGVASGGTLVTVDAHRDSCSGRIDAESAGSFQTRSDTSYRFALLSINAPFVACIVVGVTPPGASGLAATVDSGGVVQFKASYGALDSARVDIQLRAAP
jgi:hypothetical protein